MAAVTHPGVLEVEHLFAQGLHDSVALLSELLVSSPSIQGSDRGQLLSLMGAALLEKGETARAEAFLAQSLKHIRSSKSSKRDTSNASAIPEVNSATNIKFLLFKSRVKLDKTKEAVAIMATIPSSDRTPLMNLSLAKLHESTGAYSDAIVAYKAVLLAGILALDVVMALIRLGENSEELIGILETHRESGLQEAFPWVVDVIKGHGMAATSDHKGAVALFQQIHQNALPENVHIMAHIAEWQWKQSYLPASVAAFEAARKSDSLSLLKMDVYAHVLMSQGQEAPLNALVNDLLEISRDRPEPWLAAARLCQLRYKALFMDNPQEILQNGLSFVDKALALAPSSNEALLVKGTLLLQMDKAPLAAAAFRDAFRHSFSYAACQGLVTCFLTIGKIKEALAMSREAVENSPRNPRALTLLGSVCRRFADGNSKARVLFQNALSQDSKCMDAVFAMVDLDTAEGNFDKAIELLNRNMNDSRVDYANKKLGDVYMAAGKHIEAISAYNRALSYNAHYAPAKQALDHANNEMLGQNEEGNVNDANDGGGYGTSPEVSPTM
eukprot:m.89171 g.89171  ORF g.89171 m.89171 type:complete len:555 (-) comp13207_c1_seq1:2308-3972(-)